MVHLLERVYTDIGTKKSCGIISYIKFAIESGSFWITNDIHEFIMTTSQAQSQGVDFEKNN